MQKQQLTKLLTAASLHRKMMLAFVGVILVTSTSVPVTMRALDDIEQRTNESRLASETAAKISEMQVLAIEMATDGQRYADGAQDARGDLDASRARMTALIKDISTRPDVPAAEQAQWAAGWRAIDARGFAAWDRLMRSPAADRQREAIAFREAMAEQVVATEPLARVARKRNGEARNAITSRIEATRPQLLMFSGLAIAVALLTAYLMAWGVMRRLNRLRTAAHRLAQGDLGARADDGGSDEIAGLIADFNIMASSLQFREAENRNLQLQLQASLHHEQERATRDPLTSLRNHRYFQDKLSEEMERATRMGGEVTIAVLDLDNFKQVNDRYGHDEGDAVLLRVTQAITSGLRPYDTACRLGGEEFGVIFPQASAEEVDQIVLRISQAVRNAGPHGGVATFSCGIASFPRHANSKELLFQHADAAAYSAKSRGKNQNVIYNPIEVAKMGSDEHTRQRERATALTTAKALVAAVDQKDPYTKNHSELVAAYAREIARGLGLDDEYQQQVYQCGLLHDVGKIGIADAVLTKEGRLTEDEYQQVKQHPEFSYRIIQNADIEPIATWVRHHHEHWDGSGYPFGLAGTDIPLASRITLVADAFEAMTSDRAYRRALTMNQALEELMHNAGAQFDPQIVEVMVQLAQQGTIASLQSQFGRVAQQPYGSAPVAPPPGQPQAGPTLPPAHQDSQFYDDPRNNPFAA